MPINISEDINGVDAFLRELSQRLSNLTPFFNDFAAPLIIGELSEIFLTEGRGGWADLSPEYAERKAETHPGKTILRRDDNYIGAATSTSHPANIFETSPTEMTFGVDGSWFESRFGENYPERHELGLGVPQREVFGKLTETGELDANFQRLGEKWATEEIAEVERIFG